jgi:hypothetical protein
MARLLMSDTRYWLAVPLPLSKAAVFVRQQLSRCL